MKKESVRKIAAILIVLVSCFGCATAPTYQELSKYDYGQPLTINYEIAIKDYMQTILKDSFSAHYKFGAPFQGWAKEPPHLLNGRETTGYFIPVGINAKNSYGGYTGYKSYLFVFKNNQIVRVFPPESLEFLKLSKNPEPIPQTVKRETMPTPQETTKDRPGKISSSSDLKPSSASNADYGNPISISYRAVITNYFNEHNISSDSDITFQPPCAGWIKEQPWDKNGRETAGYIVFARVDEKDYLCMFRNNQLVKVLTPEDRPRIKLKRD